MFLFFTIAIFILFVWGGKYCPRMNDDYLGKDQANAIKGFFILFLTVGHIIVLVLLANDLYPQSGYGNRIELALHQRINQLVVVMFLFFSGYGISENVKKSAVIQRAGSSEKADWGGYIRVIPRRRVLNTWINYAVGIIIYIIFTPLTGKSFSWSDLPLYLTCQKSIGAPTWYIFIILLCYLTTWLSASLFKKSRRSLTISHTLMILLVGFVLSLFKEDWWYDTILCYAFGFFYSQYKTELEPFLIKKWALSLVFTLLFLGTFYYISQQRAITWLISFNLLSICFAMLFIMLGIKFKFGNKAINWCGAHLFPIYMYQGLVYHILFNIGGQSHTFATWSPFAFSLVSIILTIVLARFYHIWEIKIR